MSTSLIDFVRQKVSPHKYYTQQFPDLHWPDTGTEARIECCFHPDKKTPSLHFNPDTGAWYCHGCGAGGKSIISFHEQRYNLENKADAARDIFTQVIHPVVPEAQIKKWVSHFKQTPWAQKYLGEKRLLSTDVIKKYQIGWDGVRFTIPIRNEFGLCVNVKMYDPLASKHGTYKMVNYKVDGESRSFGRPCMFYPLEAFDAAARAGYIVLCEGEWDTLLLLSLGIPAITVTAGSKSWAEQYNERFRGLKIIVAYDNDKDGTTYDRLAIKHLANLAKSIKRLDIPKQVRGHKQKDVTDWAKNWPPLREKKGWLEVLRGARTLLKNKPEAIAATEIAEVNLHQASEARYGHRRIRLNALVTGKGLSPYLLPSTYRVTCARECEGCPLSEANQEFREVTIDPKDPNVLQLVDINHNQLRAELFRRAGFAPAKECRAEIQPVSHQNIEGIVVIPTLEDQAKQYVTRTCFYTGHGLHTNRAYQFEGITVPDPQNQQTTHLFDAAKPVQGEVDAFTLTDELSEKLKVFRPRHGKILAHLMSVAEWQSRNVTKIRERPDLHIAVDLVFHSVGAFTFHGEFVPRGMLDVLVIGDTRCGKGYVAEGLTRFYGIGQVASGENCTFAGLVGGVQKIGERWMVTWGLIPLNHGRLVVIDEASALSPEDIGKMSRVRSEGVAETSKIVRETTPANTRLLWLSNPRSGRPILSYNTGVDAIKELMGANEDISRFDFVLSVATNEVSPEIINALDPLDTTDADRYPRDLCRSLVLWAWSRTADQVRFTDGATRLAIEHAVAMSDRYSPAVPLVQGENVRIKIAKIAAAVAACCFNADETGQVLVVDEVHVQAAVEFMRTVYGKPSLAYDTFSQANESGVKLDPSEKSLDSVFKALGNDEQHAITGLLRLTRISPDSLGDYMGDVHLAKEVTLRRRHLSLR